MNGRVLREALTGGEPVEWHTATHRAERRIGSGTYRQHITLSHVDDTTYVDEGNAAFDPD